MKMLGFLISLNLNLFLTIIIIVSFSLILFYYSRIKQINILMGHKKRKKETKERKSLFYSFKEKLYIVLLVKNKEKKCKTIFNLFLIFLFSVFIGFLIAESLFLGICVPVLIFFFTNKILDILIIDFDSVVRKNFSVLVNHMVKEFSKTNDLEIVLYESSKKLDEPLRSLILRLSREMITGNDERQLTDFISTTENLWLHSFIFTLMNYKETSLKEDVISNLLELSNMIEKRNEISEKMVADRVPVVIINYMLLVVGFIIFVGNLILNPIMKDFIFTLFGSICFLIGISAIFSTIIVNMKLTKQ